ncbi:rhamnan synthesis F family protein, partial [Nocardioides sp. P5_C9_2]
MDEFLRQWLTFVQRWAEANPETRSDLITGALTDGLAAAGDADPWVDPDDRLRCEVALIAASGELDPFGYFLHNQDLLWDLCGRVEEVEHFARRGWHELRHPSPRFDLWWYWKEHLDPTREDVNPLVHYLVAGRHQGLATLPEVQERSAPPAPDPSRPPRRVCLFAGFDVDGLIDPTVVSYVAELSRFADVYYLADCALVDGELDKLAPYTKGRWAIRHGRYDFGSYSMLAGELVGWDTIEEYDELVLTNDSCYLVQPLDRVFAKMDATACDWWGLQATYEKFSVTEHERHGGPLGLDSVEEQMRRLDLWRYSDFIHVGSYFLTYRRRVLSDPAFRRALDQVAAQVDKT